MDPQGLVIIVVAGLVFGAIGVINLCWSCIDKQNCKILLPVLIVSAEFIGCALLPLWQYSCEHIFTYHYKSEPMVYNFYNKRPELFICHDFGMPFSCATDNPEDQQYVMLTNLLARLAFIRGCVEDSIPFMYTMPMLLALIFFWRSMRITVSR